MSAWRRVACAGGAGAALALVALLVLRAAEHAAGRQAVLLVGAAVAAAVVAPWRAARGPARAAALELLALVAGALVVAAPAAVLDGVGGSVGGLLWVALFGLALVGLARLAGRAGQALATAAGLLLVAAPYVAGPLTLGLPPGARPAALEAALHTPVPVLGGTFAGADALRSGRLYREFPLVDTLPFQYPSPTQALAVVALAALALAALALLRAHARRALAPRRLAPAPLLALLLLAGAAGDARAQLFPEPGGGPDGPQIGDLQTRVQLGYWVPQLTGYAQVAGFDGERPGSQLSFRRVLELDPIYMLPTFEVHLAWQNAGRIYAQYFEGVWHGEATTDVPRFFEEAEYPAGAFIETRYRYRTIALGGELHIPISDFLTLRLLTTQRYVKHEIRVRSVAQGISERNSLETFMPTIGGGIDVFIWNVISAYADIQWLDVSTTLFGAADPRWQFRYTEWRVGVRLELVQHAHVSVEMYSLDTTITDGRRDRFRQHLFGPRLQVAILF
ncbi:MAG: hypothetical protein M9894_32720 [Planctomycetes bacterium]|nr:hypothetical protein [Planctomycetota bacterium]